MTGSIILRQAPLRRSLSAGHLAELPGEGVLILQDCHNATVLLMSSPTTTSTRETRNVSISVPNDLWASYGGKCVATRHSVVNNCHIIPFRKPQNEGYMRRLKKLGLVPDNMKSVSYQNLVPLAPTLHACFDSGMFTFYPTTDVLLQLTEIEEGQVFNRITAVKEGLPDPGRPSYEQSYGAFPKSSKYHCVFPAVYEDSMDTAFVNAESKKMYSINFMKASDEHPLLPDISLTCNPNIVVLLRTGILSQNLLPDGQEKNRTLGLYLMELWDFSPGLDHLEELLEIRPVSLPSGCLQSLTPSTSSSSGGTAQNSGPELAVGGTRVGNMQVDSAISTVSSIQPPCTWLPLTPPPSPANQSLSESDSGKHQSGVMLKVGGQFYPLAERGTNTNFTSNEWAKLCYEIDLTSSTSKPDGPK